MTGGPADGTDEFFTTDRTAGRAAAVEQPVGGYRDYRHDVDDPVVAQYRGQRYDEYSAERTAPAFVQELLGFSLAEVRVVLDTEDIEVLDRVRSEYRAGSTSPARRRQLLDEAIEANDKLLGRLDETLAARNPRLAWTPG